MADSSLSSVELWAAGKICGRECSTLNKIFYLCKKEKGANPDECFSAGKDASSCCEGIVGTLKTQVPKEFASFTSCLDKNDYRYSDCRKEERALLDCWNDIKGYKAVNNDA